MEKDSLSYKTLKNASYGFVGYAWPILFSVFITPIVVKKLGVVDYGVYVLINTITAFLTLIDLGLTTALVKYVSEYSATQQKEKLQHLVVSANSLFLLIGSLGFLVFCVLGKFFLHLFHISSNSQTHVFIVFILAGLVFFVNATAALYALIPQAVQRYDIATKLSVVQLTVFNVGVLIAVLLGYKLKIIFAWNLVTALLFMGAFRWYAGRLLPELRFSFGWWREEIAKSYRFGIFAALTSLSYSALMQLDRLLIPAFLGPVQLTYYSLPGNVAQKTAGVTGSLGSIFFPLASALHSRGETQQLTSIYKRGFRNITLVAAAISSAIACFSYQILAVWLGPEFANQGNAVLIVLAATYFLLSLYGPLTNFLLGLGAVKFLVKTSTFLAVLNLVLLFLLVPHFGIMGAAWAFLGGVAPIPLVFCWAERKILLLPPMGTFYAKLYSQLVLVTVIFFLVSKLLLVRWTHSLAGLIIVGPLSVLFYLTCYIALGFMESEDYNLLSSYFERIKIRLKLNFLWQR